MLFPMKSNRLACLEPTCCRVAGTEVGAPHDALPLLHLGLSCTSLVDACATWPKKFLTSFMEPFVRDPF